LLPLLLISNKKYAQIRSYFVHGMETVRVNYITRGNGMFLLKIELRCKAKHDIISAEFCTRKKLYQQLLRSVLSLFRRYTLVDSSYKSWDSVVDIATGRPRGRSSSPGRVKNFHVVHTGSGVYPTSIQWVPGALSPGVKLPWGEAYHSPPASAEVKKVWMFTSIPSYAFMA
jgi:hypothetical protein